MRSSAATARRCSSSRATSARRSRGIRPGSPRRTSAGRTRSEEHTSELQSQSNLVCRLLLEKKKKKTYTNCEGRAVTSNSLLRLKISSLFCVGSRSVPLLSVASASYNWVLSLGWTRIARTSEIKLPRAQHHVPASHPPEPGDTCTYQHEQTYHHPKTYVDAQPSLFLFSPPAAHLRFLFFFFLIIRRPPRSTLFPYPTLSRSSLTPVARNRRPHVCFKSCTRTRLKPSCAGRPSSCW